MRQYPIVLRTAGDHYLAGSDIYATCYRCQHSVQLDMVALIACYGPDVDLRRRLRCAVCGARSPQTTIVSPPTAAEAEKRQNERRLLHL